MSALFSFAVSAQDGAARTGAITSPRGVIRTPAFMPVGTAATVKAMFPEDVASTGADIILGNTYHLMLRPGAERVAKLGGLHTFMHWDKPILTDSGGYQVMSLAKLRRITEEGVTFQSHLDGATVSLTPERAIEVQCLLGSDIQMVLDECTPHPATRDEAKASLDLSMRWAERSKAAFGKMTAPGQALFGIVQGSVYADLRAGHAGRHCPGHRHVRLRHADPLRAPRPSLHLGRTGELAQCPLCGGPKSARSGKRLSRRAI
jgi:queuine tRNA-ribosyltransferase